jgi:hypothetical protein
MCRYSDNQYEYRHVQLPKAMLKAIPRDYFDPAKGTLKLLWEDEWRGLGITQVGHVAHHSQAGPLTDPITEPGLGALLSPLTGTTYSTLQVSQHLSPNIFILY